MAESPDHPSPARSPLADLSEEERLTVLSLPRAKRLEALAEILGHPAEQVLQSLAEASSLRVELPSEEAFSDLGELPPRLIFEYQCLPSRPAENGTLHLVTVWPPEPEMDAWIYTLTGKEVSWTLGPPDKVVGYLTQKLGVGFESLDDTDLEFLEDHNDEQEEDETATIVRFVNDVIRQAVEDGATDIHMEPQEEFLRIRYRIDGLLLPIPVPDNLRRFQDAIISRIKIMSKMNISERRLPQDGRITFQFGDADLDIRVSTIATMYGESVSLRLLNKASKPFTMEQLGLLADDRKIIDQVLYLPHGIILVTGPTGAGKSTSLNAFIREINSPEKRIITVEDPVEYEVPGVNQIQVRPEIGLEFASALRHILRQDPDVIMVGEIRDRETADIAIRASLTGHLVFSTLHTNDAPSALTRLTDMGIEPFLIASAVELVMAQRLIRRLCPRCAKEQPVDRSTLEADLVYLGINPREADKVETLKMPVGCDHCRQMGFRGRVGLFEILRVTEDLHDLIVNRESAREIRKVAAKGGMKDLRYSGWEQVLHGRTVLEEVMRVTAMDG